MGVVIKYNMTFLLLIISFFYGCSATLTYKDEICFEMCMDKNLGMDIDSQDTCKCLDATAK